MAINDSLQLRQSLKQQAQNRDSIYYYSYYSLDILFKLRDKDTRNSQIHFLYCESSFQKMQEISINEKNQINLKIMFFQQVHKGQNDFWRYLIVIIGVIAAYVIGQIPLTVVMFQQMAELDLSQAEFAEIAGRADLGALGIELNWGMFLLLLSFVAGFFALWLMVDKIHLRPFRTVLTSRLSLDWKRIFYGFGLWMGLTMSIELVAYFLEPENYILQFDLMKFLPLLAISLLILPIQTSFEEVFMRGYLMQGIGLIAKFRWLPLLITSVLFGLLHSMNPEVQKWGMSLMMSYYIGVGLMLGIITLMDDGLELALGVHAATNIYGALFFTFEDSALQTPAIFRMKEVHVDYMLLVFFVMAGVFVLLCARKYGWKDWSKAFGLINRFERQV